MAPRNVLVREYELRSFARPIVKGKRLGILPPNLTILYAEQCKRRISLYGDHTSVLLYGEPTAEL
jgi:hypothetical protein